MTSDQQSAGRTPRWFRGGLRVAAVGSALCLAAGMGLSMASQASAAAKPGPGFHRHDVLPVCISFGGILRLALPFSTCNGPIVPLEIAGDEDHHPVPSGIDTYVRTDSTDSATADAAVTGHFDLTADAHCDAGDVATGGGFSVSAGSDTSVALANIPTVTLLDAPTTDGHVSSSGEEPNDWTAGIEFGPSGVTGVGTPTGHSLTITVYVVCTQGAHHHM